MRRIAAGMTLAGLLLVMVPMHALAKPGQEVCPNERKVESVVDGDLDGIVIAQDVQVCIKAGTDVVYAMGNGVLTLAELVGNGKNVSHYSILDLPEEPTTTTTVPEETTTTVPDGETTVPEETTTTVPQETTTTQYQPPDTVTVQTPPTTVPPTVTEQPPTLPHTGPEDIWLAGLGLALLAGGGALVRSAKD